MGLMALPWAGAELIPPDPALFTAIFHSTPSPNACPLRAMLASSTSPAPAC